MNGRYILDDNNRPVMPRSELVAMEWWTKNRDRKRVGYTELKHHRVSTVFLGIDHQYGDGPPLLFESMTFDEKGEDVDMTRYSTWEDAEIGHQTMVRRWQKVEEDASNDA